MVNVIKDRQKRLKNLVPKLKNMGLISYAKINKNMFAELQQLSFDYLADSLFAHYGRRFRVSEDFLVEYADEIRGLPNITPNGLCLPKAANFLAYNRIHQHLVKLTKLLGVENYSHAHCPVNIRIIDGANLAGKDRPRSSMKMHLDIWAADPADTVMCHINVAGDIVNNGMKLWEPPPSIYPDFIRPFDDFNISDTIVGHTPYDLPLSLGSVYFLDSYVLHQTVKNADGLRLTVTIPMIYEEKLKSDVSFSHGRHTEYLPKEEWLQMGTEKILYSDKKLGEYTKSDTPMNSYADKYKIVSVS